MYYTERAELREREKRQLVRHQHAIHADCGDSNDDVVVGSNEPISSNEKSCPSLFLRNQKKKDDGPLRPLFFFSLLPATNFFWLFYGRFFFDILKSRVNCLTSFSRTDKTFFISSCILSFKKIKSPTPKK